MAKVKAEWDSRELRRIHAALDGRVLGRVVRKAGSTALRDMRAEASKRVRARKRVRVKAIRRALVMARPRGGPIDGMEWGVHVRGDAMRLIDYPGVRQTKRGVSVAVNKGGGRTLIEGAFIATVGSGGHRGVFRRGGRARLPIKELLGSRPVDALLHDGEAEGVQRRGRDSFARTFDRVLAIELDKVKGGAG